jgi:hypothetical protein
MLRGMNYLKGAGSNARPTGSAGEEQLGNADTPKRQPGEPLDRQLGEESGGSDAGGVAPPRP